MSIRYRYYHLSGHYVYLFNVIILDKSMEVMINVLTTNKRRMNFLDLSHLFRLKSGEF